MFDLLAALSPEAMEVVDKAATQAANIASSQGHTVIYWLLGLCLTGMFTLYAFMIGYYFKANSQLANIYKCVHNHMQNKDIHPEIHSMVHIDVCQKEQELTRTVVRHVHEKIDTFSKTVEKLDTKVDKVLVSITQILGAGD